MYPTRDQEQHLIRTFGCVRYVWNWALRLRSEGFQNGERIGLPETGRALTTLKQQPETLWLSEVSSVCLQQSLRDLQLAFSAFFDKRTRYPSFKRKNARQSANYTQQGFSFDPRTRTLKLAKIGRVKVKWSRKKISLPSSVRVIRTQSGRYFVSLVVDVDPVPLPKTGQDVGIDFGINRLATLHTGETISNPKHGERHRKRLARLQRELARKQKGSKRRARCKRKLARLHEKISDCRSDTIKKFATSMVRRFDTIFIEDLDLRGMLKNHKLARSLSDASLGIVTRTLEAKAAFHDKAVVKINRWYPSSKTCSDCGFIKTSLQLSERTWVCPECGVTHDRDINAARNILAVGYTVNAHGSGVRAVKPTGSKANPGRSANRREVEHRV